MADKVILKVIAGPLTGKELEFSHHDTFIFGRMDDCHFYIPDDNYLSRHHFILEVNPPGARIRDLGSLNGTFVNEKIIGGRLRNESPEEGAHNRTYPELDLHDGDKIKAGDTCFRMKTIIEESSKNIIQCQRCGKNVSAEISLVRESEFICTDCVNYLTSNSGDLWKALFINLQSPSKHIQIPDYEIKRLLGKGGMGEVYQAKNKVTGSEKAIKVLLPKVAVNSEARDQFIREIQTISSLHHPNIVRFVESGQSGSAFCIIMELCNGGNLQDVIESQNRPFTEDELIPIMLGVLDGLAYAHSKGFVHRDLKPQNILIAHDNNSSIAKISDFGIAKNFTQAGFSGMTLTGKYSGSHPFMPREQVTNFKYVKPTSDVWSIAATFYYALTGYLPCEFRKGEDPLEAILRGSMIPILKRNNQISKGVANVIDKSLSITPENRFQDAGQMRKALKKVS